MGIAPYLAEAIVREHKFRPIKGDVLLLGRQTFLFTPEQAVAMIRGHGLEPATTETEIDATTLAGVSHGYIKDSSFFALLGATSVRALDVTDYEGAEIIWDLNKPIPDELESSADFILDGSTLDNLFNPATALQSIARILRPGGRLLSTNGASAHASPYTMATPHWFVDYFAMNGFADFRSYLTLHGYYGSKMMVLANRPGDSFGRAFLPNIYTGVVVFAEKGKDSTWDKFPCQRNYALSEQLKIYAEAERRAAASGRPELLQPYRHLPFRFSLLRSLVEHYKTATSAKDYQIILPGGRRKAFPAPLMMRFARPLRRMFGV